MGGYYGDMDTFMIDEGILNKLVTFGSYDGLLLVGTIKYVIKMDSDFLIGIIPDRTPEDVDAKQKEDTGIAFVPLSRLINSDIFKIFM